MIEVLKYRFFLWCWRFKPILSKKTQRSNIHWLKVKIIIDFTQHWASFIIRQLNIWIEHYVGSALHWLYSNVNVTQYIFLSRMASQGTKMCNPSTQEIWYVGTMTNNLTFRGRWGPTEQRKESGWEYVHTLLSFITRSLAELAKFIGLIWLAFEARHLERQIQCHV